MRFAILGPIEVSDGEQRLAVGGPRQLALLAFLLLHANKAVSNDRLIEALWGEASPGGAVKRLQVAVMRLRKALEDDGSGDEAVLRTVTGGYLLAVAAGELDAEAFEVGVKDGHRALEADEPERAAELLADALGLWRGPPLAELDFADFAQTEIRRLEELRLTALEMRAEAQLRLGDETRLVGELEALVSAHPTRERLVGLLMLALYRCGRQTAALEAYRNARRGLVEDVGVEPGPQLRRLHEAILQHDPSLEPEPEALPHALDVSGAPPLLGRDGELAWLRERWARARSGAGTLATVLGQVGVGKSRLVAEMANQVHRENATVLYADGSDGREAVLATARRARAARRPTLIVIDDVEHADAGVRAALRALKTDLAAARILVIAVSENQPPSSALEADLSLALGPLDVKAVRQIALFYVPDADAGAVPAQRLLEASDGVARRVHEVAGNWARDLAARKLGASAGRAAAGRHELRSMEAEVAGDVVELQAARERAASVTNGKKPLVCPFKGLASFDVADAPYFFGREALIAELVARLVGAPLLGIVGPSGSGKSSVLRAGLLPALAGGVLPGSEDWPHVLMRPGEHQLRDLRRAAAGAGGDGRVLIAVDQFEEAFTACRDEAERGAFIAEIVRAARDRDGRAVLVLALRADYYGRCAAYPELASLLAANHVLVRPMRRDELREAIERPALRVGLSLEPALADALVAAVVDEPGALPLLSTALLELWQRRDGRWLRHATYESSGGVRGAVARLAENAYGELDRAQQGTARRVLLRLAGEDATGTIVRRRVPQAEVETWSGHDVERVVALLTERRLLTASAGTVEVAHEALLREWPRLRGWLEQDADRRRLHRHLTDAARDWDHGGRDPGDLYRGARLASALEFRPDHEDELSPTEAAFLDASRAAGTRAQRRLRTVALGLAALVLVAAASAILALAQADRAESQRRLALSRSLAAQAVANLDQDADLARLLSLEAYRAKPTIEARSAILAVLPTLEHADGTLRSHAAGIEDVAFSPDGKTLATVADDKTVRLWDVAARGTLGAPLRGHTDEVWGVAFSPDGQTLVTSGADRTVRLWDVASRRALGAPLRGHNGSVNDVAFSPDGRTLATASADRTVRLWDVAARGALGAPFRGHTDSVSDVEFSPDGKTLATASRDRTVRLWDVAARGALGAPLRGHTDWVWGVVFSPDGRTLATASADNTVRLWDIAARRALGQPLRGHAHWVLGVAFSPDGETLATTGDDKTVRLWDVDGRRALGAPLRGHTDEVGGVVFSPDGQTLATASRDTTVRLWDVTVRRALSQPLTGHTQRVAGVAFSPDGQMLASTSLDTTVRLWDVAARRALGAPLQGHTHGVPGVAFSPDGQTLATASRDTTVRLWDVASRRPLGAPLRGHTDEAWGVAFSPDGQTLATAGADKTVRLWDVASRRALGAPLRGHTDWVNDVAFSPDGNTLATSSDDKTVRLWDVASRRPLGAPLKGHAHYVWDVAFSPDGRTLATAGDDKTVRLWDVASRRPLGQPLRGHTNWVLGVAFSPDGKTLATASSDKTVRLWDPILWSRRIGALRARLCAAVGRSLTRAEWAEFLPGEPYHATCGNA